MCHVDRGRPELRAHLLELSPHGVTKLGVQVAERLIQEKQIGLPHQRPSQRGPLSLSVAERLNRPVQQMIDLHHLSMVGDPFLDFFLGQPELRAPQGKGHVVENIELRIEGVTFKHHRHIPVSRLQAIDIAPSDPYAPAIGGDNPGYEIQCRRFARAGWSKYRQELLVPDIQTQIVDTTPLVVILGQSL